MLEEAEEEERKNVKEEGKGSLVEGQQMIEQGLRLRLPSSASFRAENFQLSINEFAGLVYHSLNEKAGALLIIHRCSSICFCFPVE
jgi:hypothetical protein